jgi:lipooligosaccharide transport system permease protein
MPYIVFLASGIVCASAMNAATLEATYSAYVRMSVQQTWDGILATPLGVRDIVFGELAWTGTKSFINAAPILLVATALGAVHDWRALWVLPLVIMVGLTFGAMALVVTAFARGFDFFLYYATLVITPMFLLSGVFFPLQGMPEWVQRGAQFLPLTHAVEIVRPLMTGQPVSQPGWHLIILVAYTVGGFLLAVRLFRRRLIS